MSRDTADLTPLLEACRAEERERLRKLVEIAIVETAKDKKKFSSQTHGFMIRTGRINALEWVLNLLESKQ